MSIRATPWNSAALRVLALSALIACGAALPNAQAADAPTSERLQVADPFLEMRTGPGRGYPVFHVAARSEWIVIELRHTDWYKVRLEADGVGATNGTKDGTKDDTKPGGKEGWVHRSQLQTTLTEAGGQKSFRDIALDDYLNRRVELGGGWGRFKSEPMLKLWAGYRLSETLSAEATFGQVQGVFSGTDFWHLNLQLEPWSDKRLSPFIGIGFGKFRNIPNASLVGAATTNAKLADATIGLRYHVSERFVLRADYSLYTSFVADTRSLEYRAVTAGIGFFF